ncbi:MAG: tRNA (adenine(22)-N(1))-methyltransferase TrmK, partial [Bacteriovoracaceae bacterium]
MKPYSGKISKRLTAIVELLEPKENLWDICCDHGDVAFEAAKRRLAVNIYAVDKIDSIVNSLTDKVEGTDIPRSIKILPLLQDAAKTPQKICSANIVLAGIGENTAIKILEQLDLAPDCHLILAIHSDNYLLREYLIQRDFKTLHEFALKDKNKIYEILKLSLSQGEVTTKVGKMMWEKNNPTSFELLQQKISYLERKLRHEKDAKSEEYLKQ